MTSIGIEVDSVEEVEKIPGGLAGVVVAKVVECIDHPDSDHLHITKVDDGSGDLLTVVCGAPNVQAGQKVFLARIGTKLPGDFKIKKSKIRGVESFGMICAEDELGLGESHEGIMVLEDDAVVGMEAKEYLHLETEAVIEYEITANRVDAASHWGVARDLYAWMKLRDIPCELVLPSVEAFKEGEGEGVDVELVDSEGAPRYLGITLRDLKVAPSPQWLQDRLTAVGLRPISNIVDISNFVLFELGQPLHTFDADKINGKIVVRKAKEGENLRTLDGVDRKLSKEDVVVADEKSPMCIAGVFGGENSGISDSTVSLFIESAYFNPTSIRRTSKFHGLQTDASFRYERGADPEVLLYALKRAATLAMQLAGGRVEGKIKEVYPKPIEKKLIDLDYERVENLIGQKIGAQTIENILNWLNYEFVEKRAGGAVVKAPSYMVDVYRECDVVEEILRIYGYNNVPFPKYMKMSVNATIKPEEEAVRNSVSNFLASNGFVEIMNNSLSKSNYYEKLKTFPSDASVRIVNPLSQDLNVMRQSLIPGGLEVIAYNLNRQISAIKIFEYGSVYSRLPERSGESLEGYEEHPNIMLMMSGTPEKSWRTEPSKRDYFHLKSYFELLLRRYGADIFQLRSEAAPADIFSEGVLYRLPGANNPVLAVLGTVNPALCRSFGIKQEVLAAEINWNTLFEVVKRDKLSFKELPKFPEVHRDLALLLDENVSYESLRKTAVKTAGKLLRQVSLFDVYRGDKIPAGKKQYALSFVIQNTEKTMTDADTERLMDSILSACQKEHGAQLR